jgi:hypothetical protein
MKKSAKGQRGMGAATQGGGCCMPAVRKYAEGSPKEGVTKDMLPWMSKELGKKPNSSAEGVTKDMLPWMSKEIIGKKPNSSAEGVTKDMLPWMTREIKNTKVKTTKKKPRRLPFEPMVPGRR